MSTALYTRSRKHLLAFVLAAALPCGAIAGSNTGMATHIDSAAVAVGDSARAAVSVAIPDEYAAMTEKELDTQFDQSQYIASDRERDVYASLKGDTAKRKALFDFWNSRDANPATAANEMKAEYFKRIGYVNLNFHSGRREGWKTDRGRVYVVYGPPDDIDHHFNDTNMKPYEIWSYFSVQGGVKFIFGDRLGISDYKLMHSTHRSEIHDEEWVHMLSTQSLFR